MFIAILPQPRPDFRSASERTYVHTRSWKHARGLGDAVSYVLGRYLVGHLKFKSWASPRHKVELLITYKAGLEVIKKAKK